MGEALTRQSARECEVCGCALCPKGTRVTGLCFRCRQDGAAFARAWARDLRDAGASYGQVAHVVGLGSAEAARARVSERRRVVNAW